MASLISLLRSPLPRKIKKHSRTSMPLTDYHRRSIRLQDFDYRQAGAYYITIAALHHQDLFGLRSEEQNTLNACGQIVAYYWQQLPKHFSISLGEWIVMPDHLHAIIFIENGLGVDVQTSEKLAGTQSQSLAAVVQNFKSITTRKINQVRRTSGLSIWQRNYYEHIIRNDRELNNIRRYIAENPLRHHLRATADYDK